MEEERVVNERALLKMFVRDMEKFSLLGKEEELIVARQARAGDRTAANRLVEANLRFVVRQALRRWQPGLPLMDLVSEGCWGLMIAVRRFNPDRGVRFLSFAHHWVNQRIRDAAKGHYRPGHCSLDAPAFGDDDKTTLKDLVVSNEAGSDEKVSERQVSRMLSILSDRERTIIELRIWHDLTMEEIGRRLNITRTRVQQIEGRALGKMRRTNRDTFGADHGETLAVASLAGGRA